MSEKSEGPVGAVNTDTHLWPIVSRDYYAPRVFATAEDGIGIDVGGRVIVKPIRDWHNLAVENEKLRSQLVSDQYLVWSNEHRCWWRPNSAGYTLHVKAAGRYSREEALAIAKGSRRGWAEGRMPDEMAIAERDVLVHLTDEQSEGNNG